MTKFYIVRHAEAESNALGFMAGHIDVSLTSQGERQAIARAKELVSKVQFSAAFSSDLTRAKRTAEIIAAQQQLDVISTELLRERFWGNLQGRKEKFDEIAELRRLLGYFDKLTYTERFHVRLVPDMESDAELIARFESFLRKRVSVYQGQNVLVVSHSNAMRTLLVHFGFASHQELPSGAISNTGYFVLESDGTEFIVRETAGVQKTFVGK
jgi:broad specificity phosphatase PhoE